MKIKMTTKKMVATHMNLASMIRRESQGQTANFSPKVAIAISKNAKILENELKDFRELEAKYAKAAKEQGIQLDEYEPQQDMMNMETEVDIRTITENDLEKCDGIMAVDVLALEFMTIDPITRKGGDTYENE